MSSGYSCKGCEFADPRFTDPDDPDAECGYEIEGLCWKEVRDGKWEIWMDDFGNLLALPVETARDDFERGNRDESGAGIH